MYLFPLVHFINARLHFASPTRYSAIYFLQRAVSKVIGREWSFKKLWRDLDGAIFCFAVNHRATDYSKSLDSMIPKINGESRVEEFRMSAASTRRHI